MAPDYGVLLLNMQSNLLRMDWLKHLLSEKNSIGNDSVCLVLGDNIFYGQGFTHMLKEAVHTAEEENKATVFGYWVC